MMKNKYDALCHCCLRIVGAGDGVAGRHPSGKWYIFHEECYSDGKGETHLDEFDPKEWHFTQGY